MVVTLIIGIFDGFEMKVLPNPDITSPVKQKGGLTSIHKSCFSAAFVFYEKTK